MVGVAGPSALFYDNTGCPKVLGMMVPKVGEEGCGRI